MTEPRDRRRTDTRERIRAAALDLFATRGYDSTSLGEVAERLGITRPAVYHHFRSKQELLTGSCDELRAAVRGITTITGFDALLTGPLGTSLLCIQLNESIVRGLPGAAELLAELDALAARLAPAPGPAGRMRARLALAAITMAHARGEELGGTPEERRAVARELAAELLA